LLDTSIFIAAESGRGVTGLPEENAISVVTIAELHMGVLLADEAGTRATRLRTLGRVERNFDAIPIDAETAVVFASILSQARRDGRRPKTMDLWIAATAVQHDLVLFTRDADFEGLGELKVQRV
jgi:predicted nucleic acid-binding protein